MKSVLMLILVMVFLANAQQYATINGMDVYTVSEHSLKKIYPIDSTRVLIDWDSLEADIEFINAIPYDFYYFETGFTHSVYKGDDSKINNGHYRYWGELPIIIMDQHDFNNNGHDEIIGPYRCKDDSSDHSPDLDRAIEFTGPDSFQIVHNFDPEGTYVYSEEFDTDRDGLTEIVRSFPGKKGESSLIKILEQRAKGLFPDSVIMEQEITEGNWFKKINVCFFDKDPFYDVIVQYPYEHGDELNFDVLIYEYDPDLDSLIVKWRMLDQYPESYSFNDLRPWLVHDFDKDGLLELVVGCFDGISIVESVGDDQYEVKKFFNFYQDNVCDNTNDDPRLLNDINHNGYDEFVVSGENGLFDMERPYFPIITIEATGNDQYEIINLFNIKARPFWPSFFIEKTDVNTDGVDDIILSNYRNSAAFVWNNDIQEWEIFFSVIRGLPEGDYHQINLLNTVSGINFYDVNNDCLLDVLVKTLYWEQTPSYTEELYTTVFIQLDTLNSIENNRVLKSFELGQNYPNPFNPTTTIPFTIQDPGAYSLTVYDAAGRKIKELLSNSRLTPDRYSFTWNGTNESGHSVSTGIYFYRLESRSMNKSGKMLLLK